MKRLFGRDERMPYKVLAMVVFQLVSVWLVSGRPWLQVGLLAYCLGGVINHSLMLGESGSVPPRDETCDHVIWRGATRGWDESVARSGYHYKTVVLGSCDLKGMSHLLSSNFFFTLAVLQPHQKSPDMPAFNARSLLLAENV